jgi:muconate cycloisomerase
VKLHGDDGTTGYGEAVVRPYVTGETVSACLDYMSRVMWPCVARSNYPDIRIAADPLDSLSPIAASLPSGPSNGVIAWHGARAAFETALIDLALKRQRLPLSVLLRPRRRRVVYSAVIGLGSSLKTMLTLLYFRCQGLRHYKLKIGAARPVRPLLRRARAIIGSHRSIRLDANGAFAPRDAAHMLAVAAQFGVVCVEQPIPRTDVETLARLQRSVSVSLMVDESLVTMQDAQRLIDARACRHFNLRLAKCGGVVNTLELARLAEAAGLRIQLGCQVGETAILSALGRHVAAHLRHLDFVEGSFGPRLLRQDIATQPVGFGCGGIAPLIEGPGLGVNVDDTVLHKYSQRVITLKGG